MKIGFFDSWVWWLLPWLMIYDTADIVPRKLSDYLNNHPEIKKTLSQNWTVECFRNL